MSISKRVANAVRWQDGTYDRSRQCIECGKENCKYPVYKERYKELKSKSFKNWEFENTNYDND